MISMMHDIETMLWRSWRYSLSMKKFILVSVFLLIVLTIFVFCQAISVSTGPWMKVSLFFLPFFISSGFTLSLSIFLNRVYWKEIHGKTADYKRLITKSWELFLASSFVSVPIFLIYIVLWILLGAFYLIKEIHLLGGVLGSLLSFGPFFLIFLSLLLTIFTIVMLFIIPPSLALEKKGKLFWSQLKTRVLSLFPSYTFLFILGVLPLIIISLLVLGAFILTNYLYFTEVSQVVRVFQWMILEIPIAAALALPFIFFVNFALETHLHIVKKFKEITYNES